MSLSNPQSTAVLSDVPSADSGLRVHAYSDDQVQCVVRGLYPTRVKPGLDAFLAGVLLLLTLPVMLLIALAVRASMGPGVIYRQRRIGRHGHPFTVYKFRTMHYDRRQLLRTHAADHTWAGLDRRVCHKREDDPRHTPVGRTLRKSGLDELPQLVNVLRGEMSLVGPRPELVEVVRHYEPWQHARHQVKPGITGLWQVSDRGRGLMCENMGADITYVANVSLKTDLSVLAKTVPAALLRRSGS